MIFKLLGPEMGIATANDVATNVLVRIINTGAAGIANVAYANGLVYANCTIGNTESVIINKSPTDLIQGTSTMKAVPVAFRY